MISNLTREQWLALREQSIGASEAAAACGENPYDSALGLWMQKTKREKAADLSDLERIYWGNVHEPAVVRATCERLGLRLLNVDESVDVLRDSEGVEVLGVVEGRQLFLRSKPYPWMTATLDGIAQDPKSKEFGGVEAKTTDKRNADEWDEERAPDYYKIQVAHQLAVATPLKWGVLSCLVGGNSLKIAPLLTRENSPIEALVSIEREFWNRVTSDEPPAADGSPASARALKVLHPDDNGESVVLPHEFIALCQQERELQQSMSEQDKERKRIQTLIKAHIGSSTFGVLPNGHGTYSLKTTEKEGYFVGPTKYRSLLFSAPKIDKTPKAHSRKK